LKFSKITRVALQGVKYQPTGPKYNTHDAERLAT